METGNLSDIDRLRGIVVCEERPLNKKREYANRLTELLGGTLHMLPPVRSGNDVWKMLFDEIPSVFVVSVSLPDIDAFALINTLRQSKLCRNARFFVCAPKMTKSLIGISRNEKIDGLLSFSAPVEQTAAAIIEKCLDYEKKRGKSDLEALEQAINNPADEVGVKTKTLNLWCDSSNVWLPEDYIIKCSQEVDLNKFAGMDCYVGVDLAATSDLTAVAYLVVLDGTYHFKTHYYLPESALKDKADKELYKYWKQQGYLTVTSGNVTDYDYITTDMLRYADVVNIQSVGYDKYNATQWAIDSTEQGLPLEEYPQTLGNFNMPTRELERLILSGKAVIDNNEINRYCFRNVTLKSDYNGNVKPNKAVDKKKIDGTIAMIQALGMYLRTPHYTNEILTI